MKVRLIALMAVAALFAGACGSGSEDTDPAAFGNTDVTDLCKTAPVKAGGVSVLGHRVEEVSEVEVCVDADVEAAVVPTVRNQPDCGDPCFTIEIEGLNVAAEAGVTVNYKKDGVQQDPISYTVERQNVGDRTGRQCIVGYGTPDPCIERLTRPTNLRATGTSTAINLSWQKAENTGDGEVIGYDVWRSETGEEGTFQQHGHATSTSYIDDTAVAGVTYFYTVVALDNKGNVSEASNTAEGALSESKATSGNKKKGKKGKKG